jgi:hypothetical protein
MLAVSQGRLIGLSTPFGRQGWLSDAWHSSEPWERIRITAQECPRISREFLEEEKRKMPERWFRQEFGCEFLDPLDSVFRQEDIDALEDPTIKPLLRWE